MEQNNAEMKKQDHIKQVHFNVEVATNQCLPGFANNKKGVDKHE